MAFPSARVLLALCALAALAAAAPAPEPQPFNLKKFANQALDTVKDFGSSKASCLQKSGVPKSLMKKGVACGPSALMGPEMFAACAGLASIPEAKKAVKCFSG